MKYWNFKGEQNSISEALQVKMPEHAVISFVGAGGKTSLIFAWARQLKNSGKKVIIATTTHMLHPEFAGEKYTGKYIIYRPDSSANKATLTENFAKIDSFLKEESILLLAAEDSDNKRKIASPPKEIFDYACKSADVVLIEADGSRQLPIKCPKAYEPVVPEFTDISVCVVGLSALGEPTSEIMYGADVLSPALSREKVDETLIAALVSSPEAGLKGTYGEYRVFLNQADTEELKEKAAYIQKLLAVRGIQSAWGTLK